MKYKFFKDHEIEKLNIQLVMLLDYAREKAGIPFVITSGFRTEEENDIAGGVSNSAHLKGLAVDIRAKTSQERFKIVSALFDVGFPRIGVYKTHIHADLDATLPQKVLFLE